MEAWGRGPLLGQRVFRPSHGHFANFFLVSVITCVTPTTCVLNFLIANANFHNPLFSLPNNSIPVRHLWLPSKCRMTTSFLIGQLKWNSHLPLAVGSCGQFQSIQLKILVCNENVLHIDISLFNNFEARLSLSTDIFLLSDLLAELLPTLGVQLLF